MVKVSRGQPLFFNKEAEKGHQVTEAQGGANRETQVGVVGPQGIISLGPRNPALYPTRLLIRYP